MPISKEENEVHRALIKSQKEISKNIKEINKKIKNHYKKHGVHGIGFIDDLKSIGNTIKSGFEDKIEHPLEDFGNTIKSGFQNDIIDPVQNKIINPTQNLIDSLPDKTKQLFNSIPESMRNDPKFQKALDYVTKKKGGLASSLLHNGLPSLTSALGGAAGTILAPELGMFGGIAGSTAGGYAGKELADYIGDKTGTGLRRRGRPRKHHIHHSWEAEDIRPVDSALGQLLKAHRRNEERELHKGQLEIARHLHEEISALRRGRATKKIPLKSYGNGLPYDGSKGWVKNDPDVIHQHTMDVLQQRNKERYGSGLQSDSDISDSDITPMHTVKGKGISKRIFKKGSKEAKEHMARIRAMKGKRKGGKGLYP